MNVVHACSLQVLISGYGKEHLPPALLSCLMVVILAACSKLPSSGSGTGPRVVDICIYRLSLYQYSLHHNPKLISLAFSHMAASRKNRVGTGLADADELKPS